MKRSHRATRMVFAALGLAAGFWLIASPTPACAQSSFGAFTYEGAHLSTREWGRMHGPSVTVSLESALLGADLEVGYARLSAGRPEVAQWCNFISCVDGPFRERLVLDVLRAGVGRAVLEGGAGALRLAVGVTFVRQGRRLTEIATDDVRTDGSLTDFGVGSTVTFLPAVEVLGLRPMAWAGYQRIFESACAADATCYSSRNLFELGAGLAWTPG